MTEINETTENVVNAEIDWGQKVGGHDGVMLTARNDSWPQVLLRNVHIGLPYPDTDIIRASLVTGECLYFHYGCDGQDDQGWGCGYRTLQTLSSWRCLSRSQLEKKEHIPSIPEIQQALVDIGDKPPSFLGSRDWIGTFEAALVLDHLHDVPCRIVHVRGGGSEFEGVADELHLHFQTHGSPVMIGGDRDNSSKGVLGVCTGAGGSHLLVLDPHYYGSPLSREAAQSRGWISWRRVDTLDPSSFYNLCLPQITVK